MKQLIIKIYLRNILKKKILIKKYILLKITKLIKMIYILVICQTKCFMDLDVKY